MTTAENYIIGARYNNRKLTIGFDNVTYNYQMNCLFDNNITGNILIISLNTITDYSGNTVTIDRIDNLSFVIDRMYISPYNNSFPLELYSKSFNRVDIIYKGGVFSCITFSFNIGQLYLLEDLNDLILNSERNRYYINPRDANNIFIKNNNDLYLKLNEYDLVNGKGFAIHAIFFINCLSSDYNIINSTNLLMVKGEIPAKVIDYLPDRELKIYVNNNIKEAVFYFNDGSAIPINNVTPIPNENDSFIDFRGIILTEEQKQSNYWKRFYVNRIIRLEDQVFNFTFNGYRGIQLVPSTEEVIKIDVESIELKDLTSDEKELIITFAKGTPGFLGETQQIIDETVVIYLNEGMSAKLDDDTYIYVDKIKFIVEDMETIVPKTEGDTVYFNVNFYTSTTLHGPRYVAVYYLNSDKKYVDITLPIGNFSQEIMYLNVIYGEIDDDKKLLVPANVSDIWKENKLELIEVLPNGAYIGNGKVKTTNCLINTNGLNPVVQLNLVVQGMIPVEWYNWLPLVNVYVNISGVVYVNPGDTNYLIKILSVNALPSDDIGIDPEFQSSIDLSTVDL